MAASWYEIGLVANLGERPIRSVQVDGKRLALILRDGQFSVLSGVCNHAGGPLGEGRLEGDYVTCPWHYWKFHWRTGLGEPGYEKDAVPAYATKVEDGRLLVDLASGTKRSRAPHPPHPLARTPQRQPGRCAHRGDLDHFHDGGTTAVQHLRLPARHLACRGTKCRLRDAAHPPARSKIPPLRGFLLQGRSCLHLAVLDHADGSQ